MEKILLEQREHLGIVTINRPDAMNAFNYDTLTELEKVVESIRINPDIRTVVFTGAGEKAFSVGADLKERKTLTEQQVRRNVNK
ncbi:enoyl-CoA hydratase-related protein, partial [Bacillus sp. SG-1]|uniref:enoyl-CoA hydratase-related protein n=1 Tax=Bacillus sp. SG-1 TaxID=161544 RepID=UPI0005C5867E